MSFSEQSPGNSADGTWRRYEREIRDLYQTNDLEEVMRMMETERGFPKMAKKTWQEKLGHLGIRKTVKRAYWVKIYRYCLYHRLQNPFLKKGDKRLKRTKRRTEVLFGNRKFTWKQAWKNMTPARDIVGPQLDPPSPLPPGIIVQTPPPVPSSPGPHMSFNTLRPRDESTTTIHSQGPIVSSECGIIRMGNTYLGGGRILDQQSDLLESSPNNLVPSNYSSLSDCLKAQMMLHLPGIPIWNLSNTLVELADLALPSQKSACETWHDATRAVSWTSHITSTVESTILPGSGVSNSNSSVFHLSDLVSSLTVMQPSAALATFSTRDKAYITLSMAIYILSNNLANLDNGVQWLDHRDFFETLDFVFEKIPARHLQALLQSRLAGVRAAFGALLNISGVLQQHFTFKSLVEIGACNDWLAISAKGHEHLYHAVCMGLDDVIRKLLKSGCRPDKLVDFGPPRTPTTAIIEALERHDIKCVELLLKHCDVNNQFQFGRYLFITSFTFFIQKKCQVDDMLLGQGIKLFLDAGADINSLLDKDPYLDSYDTPMRLRWQDNRIWSVQDYLFCFRPGLFNEFAPSWTPPQASQPTRAGILTSLKSGPSMLNEYCNKLEQNIGWQYVSEYLELLVAEQLTGIGPWSSGPRSVSDLETVCALVDFGVSMDQVLNRAPCLLTDYMEGRRGKKCDMKVIQYLLDNHAIVDDRALQEAVRWHGTDLLATLLQNTTSIRQRGVDAVVEAATTNNFDAVNMLLDAGVDVNTDSVRNPTLFRYLDIQSAGLLEGCGGLRRSYDNLERREIFEDMFRKGALLRPGAPLAAWIRMGGGAGLVKEMLLRGVKIDAYWHNDMFVKTALQEAAERCNEELVLLLLENDANPNAHARGKDGKTALQAICNYYPRSSAVKAQQLSIIKLLLDSSAKVNAAPAQSGGLTALQLAAKHGNLEVTMLLLSCNPPADVNMPPCEYPESFDPCGNALDLAAQHGRLDVVKLLLNNDALSSCPGNTGYDGAIQGAEKKGWLAVADLIRQHAMAVSRSNTTRTNLTQPQRDWHEYGYDDYSDGYTTFDEDEEEDAEDNESAESREKEDSVAQVQIQTEAVEYPGTEHAAPEPGWVSDMEVDDSPEFDIGFSNLDGDMGSLYGLDYAPSTSHLNTAASGWGLGQ